MAATNTEKTVLGGEQAALEYQIAKSSTEHRMEQIDRAMKNGSGGDMPAVMRILRKVAEDLPPKMTEEWAKLNKTRGTRPAWYACLKDEPDFSIYAVLAYQVVLQVTLARGANGKSADAKKTAIALSVGKAVALRAAHSAIEQVASKALATRYKYLVRKTEGPWQAQKLVLEYAEKGGLQPLPSKDAMAGIGQYFLGLLEDAGYIEVRRDYSGRDGHSGTARVVIPDEVIDSISESIHLITNTGIDHQPMVCPPKEIKSYLYSGPYVTKLANQRTDFMTNRHSDDPEKYCHGRVIAKTSPATTDPLRAINLIQQSEWKVNTEQLALLEEFEATNEFPGRVNPETIEIPKWDVPADIEDLPKDDETRKEFIRNLAMARGVAKTNKVSSLSRWCRIGRAIEAARMFVGYDKLYFPVHLDFRGRMYYLAKSLDPQGGDIEKSLLLLANGQTLTESGVREMLIDGANLWGLDKESYANRELSMYLLQDDIMRWADDPVGTIEEWAVADEPYQFIAWAREITRYWRDPEGALIYWRVQRDGSNNGVQHHAALSLDTKSAETVNLRPADAPRDIYGDIARELVRLIALEKPTDEQESRMKEAALAYGINRKTTKRCVMTLPYGSSEFARTGFIRDEVEERIAAGKEVPAMLADYSTRSAVCAWISSRLTAVMDRVLVGPMQNMEYLQSIIKSLDDNQYAEWVTPDGFPVKQFHCETKEKRISTIVGGREITLSLQKNTDKADRREQLSGIAPNFVHSMDATHMRMTVVRAHDEYRIKDFSMIHDSFGCHPNDMENMQKAIREAFVDLYSDGKVRKVAASINPAFNDSELPTGDFNLEEVLQAEYFFA